MDSKRSGRKHTGFRLLLFLLTGGLLGCRAGPQPITICQVQGPGGESPLAGRVVEIQGVVTAVYREAQADGFFVQDQSCSAGSGWSAGLLVLHERWISLAQPGDRVQIRGTVVEKRGMTAVQVDPDQVRVLEEGEAPPAAQLIPDRSSGPDKPTSWEVLEGMTVQFQTLEVSALEPADQLFWRGHARVYGGAKLEILLPVSLPRNSPVVDRFPGPLVLTRYQGVILEEDGIYLILGLHPAEIPGIRKKLPESESAETAWVFEASRNPDSKPGYPFVPVNSYLETLQDQTGMITPTSTAEPLPVTAGLLITEFLPDPAGDEPEGEWIEIFNPEKYPVPLSHFKIGDAVSATGREGMVRFPDGSMIRGKEVVVIAGDARVFQARYGFYPDFSIGQSAGSAQKMQPYSSWGGSRVQLSNSGDEILILDGRDHIVDAAAYGKSSYRGFSSPPSAPEQDASLERFPPKMDTDSGRDWRERASPSPGRLDRSPPTPTPRTPQPSPTGTPSGPTSTPVPGAPWLSEVMADPVGSEPAGEWIEIYNPHPYPLPLTGIKVGDSLLSQSGEGVFAFPSGSQILPGEVIVIANHAETFLENYGKLPDFALRSSSGQALELKNPAGDTRGNLRFRNPGDEVYLIDQDGAVLDGMAYGDSQEPQFQPSAERVPEGHSYLRTFKGTSGDPGQSWQDNPEPSPGRIAGPEPSPSLTRTPVPSATRSRPTVDPLPSATLTLPAPSPTPSPTPAPFPRRLIISEVMVNPLGADPGGEWVELINLSSGRINLKGFQLGDEPGGGREGLKIFPAENWLEPQEIIVVANRGDIFRDQYHFLPDYEIHDTLAGVPELAAFPGGPAGVIAFRNSGDEVLLLDPDGIMTDSLAYGSSTFPGFQPPVPLPAEGSSLERFPFDRDLDLAEDWREQPLPSPGKLPEVRITPRPSATRTIILTVTVQPGSSPTVTLQPTFFSTATPGLSPTPSASAAQTLTPPGFPTPKPSATWKPLETPTASLTDTITPTPEPTGIFDPDTPGPPSPSVSVSPTASLLPSAGLIFNEIHADPHPDYGDANGDGERSSDDDEFVEVVNLGGRALDISGWTLSDAVKVRFRFPEGSSLQDGCSVVVFGGGTPAGSFGGSLVYAAGSLGLNNSGDQMILRDEEGEIQASCSYGAEGGENQSLTRSPDLGPGNMIPHTSAPDSEGRYYSPGTRVNGQPFAGCP